MSESRPLRILIGALGGEGGGVLTDWLVDAAIRADLPVQSTSIPGVAQRTGATTYYVEIDPETNATLGGRRPLMALLPAPGDVDLVIASELLEAARAVEGGFVTPDRTTLIAAAHRIYAVAEKAAMGDGRYDEARLRDAVTRLARRALLIDPKRDPALRGQPLNAVMLGAIAGSGVVPLAREHFEAAIREAGIAVADNLAGFAAGFALARSVATPSAPTPVPISAPAPPAAVAALPEAVREIAALGFARLVDYQSAAYAERYLARLRPIIAADAGDYRVSRTVARHLALWMAYDDVIRVADLKSRPARLAAVRAEAGAAPDQPVHITEFFKPGIDEISAILPPALGRGLRALAVRYPYLAKLHVPMRVRTTGFFGYLRLWLLARLRYWRPRTLRYAEELAAIEYWLKEVRRAQAIDAAFAAELAELPRVIKGYGDTHGRSSGSYGRILAGLVEPALAAGRNAATELRRARDAALANPDGATLTKLLAELAPAAAAPTRAAAE